jgi:hypothetical protein
MVSASRISTCGVRSLVIGARNERKLVLARLQASENNVAADAQYTIQMLCKINKMLAIRNIRFQNLLVYRLFQQACSNASSTTVTMLFVMN